MSAPTVWTSVSGIESSLEGSSSTDVVVIGAGITGLALATMMGRRGLEVVIVSAHPLGSSVSGRSNAKITALHQTVYADLARRHGQTAAATYAAASLGALRWLRAQAPELVERRPAVTVATDADAITTLRQEAEAARLAGLHVEVDAKVAAWRGSHLGLRLDDQGQVDPVALLRHLAAQLPPSVRLRGGTVRGVIERPSSATVRGDGWQLRAAHVVQATGLPILDRSAFFSLCEPQASYVVALEQDRRHVPTEMPMMISADGPTRSVRWARRGDQIVLLVGGNGHRTGAAGSPRRRAQELHGWARDHFDGLGGVLAAWSAEDFMSPDRLPYAGPQHRLGGPVHVITGLSKWGFALGVACAEALTARIVDDELTEFGQLVDTARIPDRQGLGTVLSAQVDVAKHMVGGWAGGLTRSGPPAPVEGKGWVGRCGLLPGAVSTVDGQTRQVSAICRHLGGVVTWNDLDLTWDCPLHGSRFEPDGQVRHGPAIRGL